MPGTPFGPLGRLVVDIIGFINGLLIPLLLSFAFFFFLYGVYNYFIAGGTSEEKRSEGQKFVMWGVIAFAVIFSVWGLVGLLMVSFGFGGEAMPPIPQFGPRR